jgi:predicted Zn-dependent protease with MMP-like domain
VIRVSVARFDELVGDALDDIPERLLRLLDNVAILVEDENPEQPSLLGLYEGIALPDRDRSYTFALPDRITVYRAPLMAMCRDEDELREEVAVTVVHEIAHHFGIDDEQLHDLGWG